MIIKKLSIFFWVFSFFVCAIPGWAQSGSIEGTVKDPSGAAITKASVEISDVVSGYTRTAGTAGDGSFRFTNVPFNTYHTVVTAAGFASYAEDVDVRSAVPVNVQISLKIGTRQPV